MTIKACLLGAASMLLAAPLLAQMPTCTGTVDNIRVSKLKPGKTLADFEKVVAQHMAWYRSHGYTENEQKVARIMTPEGFSATEVMTIHMKPPLVPQSQHDAGWDAFVSAYRDVSDIEEQHLVCIAQ